MTFDFWRHPMTRPSQLAAKVFARQPRCCWGGVTRDVLWRRSVQGWGKNMFLLGASCGGCPSPKRHPACTPGLLWGLRVYSGLVDRKAIPIHTESTLQSCSQNTVSHVNLFPPTAQTLCLNQSNGFQLMCSFHSKSESHSQSSTCWTKGTRSLFSELEIHCMGKL